jgi:vacuolar-type H+-ATPase subunit F/Vma7
MEGKVAVLGDADFVMPFSALGLDTYAVSRKPEEMVESAGVVIMPLL